MIKENKDSNYQSDGIHDLQDRKAIRFFSYNQFIDLSEQFRYIHIIVKCHD